MTNNSRFGLWAAAFVASGFLLVTSFVVRAQTVDGFDPRLSFIIPGPVRTPPAIKALAVQPDGRFLVGGTFNDIDGVTQFDLARFQPGGALETAFRPSTLGPANRVGVLRDDRILANIENPALVNAPLFRRYLPDGAADPSFSIPPGGVASPPSAAVVQQDGGVIFTQEDGPGSWSIRRLFPNGSPDNNFIVGVEGYIQLLAIQRDGKILAAGQIYGLAGQTRAGIGRLHPNGSLDDSFHPTADWDSFGWIESMAVQGDGKIVVTGGFETIGGRTNIGIARLNPDGTADPGFTASFGHWAPFIYGNSIALQADGKIILGGSFDTLNDQPVLNLGRLNPDGSLDTSFNPALDGEVTGLALDASGRLLVSGYFTQVGGQARAGMARLLNTGLATESLSYLGTTVSWQRGGTAPDVWATAFELSTNGSTWTLLGEGTPVADGWQLTGVSAPLGSRIRARGFIASGYGNASQGIVESVSTVSLRILSGNLAPQPFGFALTGPANQSVVIEGSTNLQNWIPLQTNLVPANGLLPFTDPDSVTLTRRFYRGRVE